MTAPAWRERRVTRFAPAAFAAVAAGVVVATSGPPRVVLLNTALEVQPPWPQALAWLALGLGLAATARFASSRGLRWLLAATALIVAAIALDHAVFRVRLDDAGLEARGLFGRDRLAWSDVSRVDTGSSAIVVWGAGERQVRLPVGSYRSDQRETIERSIARHVRETAAARSPARP